MSKGKVHDLSGELVIDSVELSEIDFLTAMLPVMIKQLKHCKDIKFKKAVCMEHPYIPFVKTYQYRLECRYRWYYAIWKGWLKLWEM